MSTLLAAVRAGAIQLAAVRAGYGAIQLAAPGGSAEQRLGGAVLGLAGTVAAAVIGRRARR